MRYLRITERDAGQRIDNFLLRTLKGVPRSHVYRLLRSGQVRVNRGRAKPDRRLLAGDELRLPPVALPEPNRLRRAPDALLQRVLGSICLEDADFLVLNKPAGLPVHGGSEVDFGLIEVLRQARPQGEYLELAHRLDRETSGVLVVARSRPALTALHAALREGRAEKDYQALLCGDWREGAREFHEALGKNRLQGGERRVVVSEEGRAAHSRFAPQHRYALQGRRLSLMQVRIYTGRTHQIRVHAAEAGYPVAGDRKYGDQDWNRQLRQAGLKRMFLHAQSLRAELPDLGRRLECRVPLDRELAAFLQGLEPVQA